MNGFQRSFAVVVGIDQYQNGTPPLRNAVNDARAVSEVLELAHGYQVTLCLDQEATLSRLNTLFQETLPDEVEPNDRLLVYFAGHGVALDGAEGPEGFLLPQNAHPLKVDSFLPMKTLYEALTSLRCRHFLGILDCCFAGAFHWFSARSPNVLTQTIHQERYERFIEDPAWQVLTSTAHDERALDVVSGRPIGERGGQAHSPFAQALIEGLQGAADIYPPGKGVITATELHWYVRERLIARNGPLTQTPTLWPLLGKHDRGEYVFLSPGRHLNLPPAPKLNLENNPYLGLQTYTEAHSNLFFGREKHVQALQASVATQPLTVVVAPSGAGKSSLVLAGLLPRLRQQPQRWEILSPFRPGTAPLRALLDALGNNAVSPSGPAQETPLQTSVQAISSWCLAHPDRRCLLTIDQLEELITLGRDDVQCDHFLRLLQQVIAAHPDQLRVVLTLRADFEPHFATGVLEPLWQSARFFLPPMTQDELREAIEDPAGARVLYFDPPSLVDQLINEVTHTPGALPLLSFTLSELYRMHLENNHNDRTLSQADYAQLGGVSGALRQRADQEYNGLAHRERLTFQRLMLRMVSLEGGELARRRVLLSELVYADVQENERVDQVLCQLTAARLLVRGNDGGTPYVEPAHDELIRGWATLWRWIRAAQDKLPLLRHVAHAAEAWGAAQRRPSLLWDKNPRLPQLEQLLEDGAHTLNKEETRFVRASVRRRQTRRIQWAAIVVLVMAALGAVSVVTTLQRQEAQRLRLVSLSQALAAQASLQQENGQTLLANVLARQAYTFGQQAQSDAMGQIDDALRTAERDHLGESLMGHKDAVNSVAFSPTGCLLASASRDSTIRVWNVCASHPTSQVLRGHEGVINAVAFSPDGTLLASGGEDTSVRLWKLNKTPSKTSIELIRVLSDPSDKVKSVAFSPDGTTLAAAGWNRHLYLWDLTHPDLPPQVVTPNDAAQQSYYFTTVVFSPDGQTLVSGNQKGTDDVEIVRLWHRNTQGGWDEITEVGGDAQLPTGEGFAVAFSPDGQRLAAGGIDCTDYNCEQGEFLVDVWDAGSGALTLVTSMTLFQGKVYAVAFSPDGRFFAAAGFDGAVRLWDAQGLGTPLWRQQGTHGAVNAIDFSPDGRFLVAGYHDGTVHLWRVDSAPKDSLEHFVDQRPLLVTPRSGAANYVTVATSADGHVLAAGGWDRKIHLWRLNQPTLSPRTLSSNWRRLKALAFDDAGSKIVGLGDDGTLLWWDLRAESPAPAVLARGSLALFRPVGRTDEALVSAFSDGGVRQLEWPPSGPTADEARGNLALASRGASVLAQDEFPNKPATNVIDGDIATSWAAGHADETWIQVDLDRAYTINRVGVQIGPHTLTYDILTSLDGVAWTTAKADIVHPGDYADTAQAYRVFAFDPVEAQHVRLRITGTNAPESHGYQYIIHDVEVYASGERPDTPVPNSTLLVSLPTITPTAGALSARWLAVAQEGQNGFRLLDLEHPGAKARRLGEGNVVALAISADERWLAAAQAQGVVQIWPLAHPGRAPLRVSVGEDTLSSLSFNPQGTLLAAGGSGGAWFWDLSQAQPKAVRLMGHRGPITSVAFAQDGLLVSGGFDGSVSLWALTQRLARQVCGRVWRNLSEEEWRRFVGEDIPRQRTCEALP